MSPVLRDGAAIESSPIADVSQDISREPHDRPARIGGSSFGYSQRTQERPSGKVFAQGSGRYRI
jgi:hypothetical protein